MSTEPGVRFESSRSSDPIMEGKAPRHLHLLAAVSVALVGLCLYGVQSLFGGGPAKGAALPAPVDGAPPMLTEPRIDRLQSEINRQQEIVTAPEVEGVGSRSRGRRGEARIDAGRRPSTPPESPGSDAREGAVPTPAVNRYESEKQENAIAASRILTLQHQDAAGPDPRTKAPGPTGPFSGGPFLGGPAADSPDAGGLSRNAEILKRVERAVSETGTDRIGLARDWLAARRTEGDTWSAGALPALARPPAGRHLVVQGSVLPAVLLTQIRSDLPGVLSAQVTEDVYDSAGAARVLIPRGTRLVGEYDSRVADGQSAVLAAFSRMVFPNGASVHLGAMPAADASGTAGLEGDVNTHFWARFGTQFLTAAIARAVQRPNGAYGVLTSGGLVTTSDAAGQILVETARVSPRNLGAVGPTITVRRGTRIEVLVNRDLSLEPAVTGAP